MTHEDPKQQQGVGSGDDPVLIERVDRHRRNEASYRFHSQAELEAVEAERRRLEKDLRDSEVNDPLFYDFEDPEFIYQLDRRHKAELKRNTVARQGVQWKPEEMAAARAEIAEELEAITDPTKRREREEEIAQWEDGQAPPEFRRRQLTHRAQFREALFQHGRLHQHRLRIDDLEATLETLHKAFNEGCGCLEHLHTNSFRLERDLNAIEADLTTVSLVLRVGRAAHDQHENALQIMDIAEGDLREKEMALAGRAQLAEAAEEAAVKAGATVREVIRRRVRAERNLNGLFKRAKILRRRANLMLAARSDAAREVHSYVTFDKKKLFLACSSSTSHDHLF